MPLTVAELAAESGISVSTLRNWAKRHEPPLEAVPGPRTLHTWAQLFEFCEAHPNLYKAPSIVGRRATPPPRGRAKPGGTVAGQRAIADAHLKAILEAVRAAEATARTHREQLEALINAYDAVHAGD